MKEIERKIKDYEPMFHNILRRFKIKKDYEDILQQLRIQTWEFFEKFDYKKKKGKESTVLYRILCNKVIDILKVEYCIQVKGCKADANELSPKKQAQYFIKNPTNKYPLALLIDYGSANNIRGKLDFELFYKFLRPKEQCLIDLLKKYGNDKQKISEELKCTQRTVVRRLTKIKNKFNKFIIKGDLNG